MKKILHKIKSTYIDTQKYKNIDNEFYSLYIIDIFGREWRYSDKEGHSEFKSEEKILEIQKKEFEKGYIDPSNYWVYNSEEFEGKIIDSLDNVIEIFSSEGFNYSGEKLNSWELFITTEGGLFYQHQYIFKDYEKLKELVKKIKKKGIVNLNYWICKGSYDYYEDNSEFNEFKEENEIYEMSYEEYLENENIREVKEMIERDTLPDGTVPGYRD